MFFSQKNHVEAPNARFVGHRDIVTDSMARYHYVKEHLHGRIIDVGCGRGYGFDVLAGTGSEVYGIDVSEAYIEATAKAYPDVKLHCQTAETLPYEDAFFDAVMSFEVIEHVNNDRQFVSELARVARPDGFIAISTPNRLVVSEGRDTPLNPHHVKEYTWQEFQSLLEEFFESVKVVGQRRGQPAKASSRGWTSKLVDRIPLRIKYLLPGNIQDLFSVALRPPLKLEDVVFTGEDLDTAPTFLALCRKPKSAASAV